MNGNFNSSLPPAPDFIPVCCTLNSLLAVDDLAQVVIPFSARIHSISSSCRALVSGTATVVVKNTAGSTIGSVDMTAAGQFTNLAPSITTLAANDKLRFCMSGIGVGLADVCIVVWLTR